MYQALPGSLDGRDSVEYYGPAALTLACGDLPTYPFLRGEPGPFQRCSCCKLPVHLRYPSATLTLGEPSWRALTPSIDGREVPATMAVELTMRWEVRLHGLSSCSLHPIGHHYRAREMEAWGAITSPTTPKFAYRRVNDELSGFSGSAITALP